MPRCPECGAEAPVMAGACPVCGAARGETLECPNCHERIPADEEACPACGFLRVEARCAVHPERRAVGACVICGRPLCEACNQGDRPYFKCEAHAPVEIVEGWAQVYTTGDDVEAELIRDNLQAEGIDAQVLSQKDHFAFTMEIGDLAQVRVLVPAYAYEDALAVIEAHEAVGRGVAFACPVCGEAYEEGDTICSSCGAELPPATSAG
ncbi:MAG: DUF2007 domain-containing protein [Gemmatimonadetes bacterium]|nr:DUF2007 domain-containing protein [Gemmatimonadota bacterium]